MYPEYEIYFLARDSELLYDFAKLSLQNDSAALHRIHLLNISRANMRAKHVKDYLAQEGISEEKLIAGKKVLFVDTGFAGTIPRVISENFSAAASANLRTHLLSSSNNSHPSTRVFLGYMNPAVTEMSPSSLHGAIVSYEHIPRYTDRSSQFVQINGRWLPISPREGGADGAVNKGIALKYQEDLAHFWAIAGAQNVFNNRRQIYRELQESRKDPAKLELKLKSLLNDSGSTSDYLMLDLDDTLLKEVSVQFKNHPQVQRLVYMPSPQALEKYQKRLLAPPDAQKVIHYEIEGNQIQSFVGIRPALAEILLKLSPQLKSGQKRIFITSANDPARTQAVWQQLRIGGHTLQELGFEFVSPENFMNTQGQKNLAQLRKDLNLDPGKSLVVVDDLDKNIIGLGTNDSILKVPAFGRNQVEGLIINPNSDQMVQFNQNDRNIFSRIIPSIQASTSRLLQAPQWLRTVLLRDVIEIYTRNYNQKLLNITASFAIPEEKASGVKNKIDLITKYPQFADVLENPVTKIPELFKEKNFTKIASLLDLTNDYEILKIVIKYMEASQYVFPEEASILELIIKKGSFDLKIAVHVLSQPHWKDHPELVSELIKTGKADGFIARYVLSQPHWKDHPELVSELIKAGKADGAIASKVLSQPHWKDHPELVSELIKAGKADGA
ncbi:MAG: hypothetical protein KDD45_13020, partial [Bdellovibrionales bacterium]|nr:hypothetical protein [Bdellovibrionales bacterium]